jgi:hypothetical protein
MENLVPQHLVVNPKPHKRFGVSTLREPDTVLSAYFRTKRLELQAGEGVGQGSVPNQKYVVHFGVPSASPARRLDDGIPGVSGGEATLQAVWRAGEMGKVFLVRDTKSRTGKTRPIPGWGQ